MHKTPTVFRRDPDNMRYVLPEVNPGCEWVLAGEGVATRKYDGTCVMLDEGRQWWARREVKPGKTPPANFVAIEHDENTGKTVGWEPVEQTGWTKYLNEAVRGYEEPGTYELCGPKVNRNPEGFERHVLVRHADADRCTSVGDQPTFESLRALLAGPDFTFEGVVWHHPDGRMAKLKARDFPRAQ